MTGGPYTPPGRYATDPETDHTDTGHPNTVAVPGPPLLACTKCGAYIHSPDQHTDWHDLIEGNTE